MRIVIDSNQLSPFLGTTDLPRMAHRQGITLAPYVFAEMLLHPHAGQLLRQLRSFDVLVGLEPSDVMVELSRLDERGIVTFTPYNPIFTLPTNLCEQDISLAQSIKASNRAFADTMSSSALLFRKRLRDEGLRRKFSDFSETLGLLESSFIKSLVFGSVSNGNSRPLMVPDEDSLYIAVMHNRHLSRHFRMIFYYVISYSRLWANQTHNFDPSSNIDDWTDITLPLYAADGDIILTADKKLQTAIRTVEPSDAIHVKTVQEL
jgi:hypothetical protein